jgi:hypothetical protein
VTRLRRVCRPLLVVALAAAASATASVQAAAHIQVRPVNAAPADAVLWTVLAPSEDGTGTREVELAVPKGVLPFSFEDAAGWTRRLRINADGSVRSIVWLGRTRADGLATFRFLASTPKRARVITWKAVQTYRDGATVRPGVMGGVSLTSARVTRVGALVTVAATLGAALPGVALLLTPALLLFGLLLLGFTPGEDLLDRIRARRFPRRTARAPRTLAIRHIVVVRRMPSMATSALAMRPPPVVPALTG